MTHVPEPVLNTTCAHRHCTTPTERVHHTKDGHPIGYCKLHQAQAETLFLTKTRT